MLLSNERLNTRLRRLAHGPIEFFSVEISERDGDTYTLPAWVIYPPHFDRTKTMYYPMLVYVYGGPGSTTVNNSWGDRHFLWHVLMAQQGYVVISVDGRGTPQPYGRLWRKAQYKQVGLASADDHAAAVRQLCSEWSCIDPAKVGTWGWSGGGSSTVYAMCRHPTLYKAGCAVAGNYNYLM
jgi:dipeptidyl-peptidase-4|eukprot:COSAG02_NODE_314_length_24915_cov_18.575596_21_plen_181_part_00